MKIKYTGPQDSITIRDVTFEHNKAVDVDDETLAAKVAGIDGFEEVKPGRKKNADKE